MHHLLADLVHGALVGLVLGILYLIVAFFWGAELSVQFVAGMFLVLVPLFMVGGTERNR